MSGLNTAQRWVSWGAILSRPSRTIPCSRGKVSYELGCIFQLDQHHILLTASLDDSTGGDLCVGNDGFVLSSLNGLHQSQPIPINEAQPGWFLAEGKKGILAKFPLCGGFIPLDACLAGGQPHPAAGTGIFIGRGQPYDADGNFVDDPDGVRCEIMQVRWDGQQLSIAERTLVKDMLNHRFMGTPLSSFHPDGGDLLAPITTPNGQVVIRFSWNGSQWTPSSAGEPFLSSHQAAGLRSICAECEPSLQPAPDGWLAYTRGNDGKGRLYHSPDAKRFSLIRETPNPSVPQVLNRDLSGRHYLATNPCRPGDKRKNIELLRNPLIAIPLGPDRWLEPEQIHNEQGINDVTGDCVPFIDHACGFNVFLNGNWRHLVLFRACDLLDRRFYSFQTYYMEFFYSANGKPKRDELPKYGGLYLAERISGEFNDPGHPPIPGLLAMRD